MAINSSTKFGVVYTTPEALANKLASDPSSLVSGKLYFAAGATSGAIGQGLYVYNDGSADGDSVGTVAMVGAGSVVDGSHAGLVSPDLFERWNDASATADSALLKANQVATALNNYLPKAGGTLTGALTSQNIVPSADSTYTLGTDASRYKTIYADSFVGAFSGTATNATNASTADVAKRVDSSLYIKVNNTQRIAYDASDAKTLDISAGSNVSLSWDSTNNRVTIAATNTDTKYSNGDGISLSGTTFSHADTTDASADTSYGPTADASQTAKGTITINVPQIKVDKFGHVSNVSVKTFKVLDTDTNTWRAVKVNGTEKIGSTSSTALDLSAGTNISLGYSNNKVTISTTGVPTTIEMNTAISNAVSSLFKYVGDTSATPTSATVGQTWRASSAFTIATTNSVTGTAVSVEVGDVLLCTVTSSTAPKFTVIQNNITNNVSFSGTPTNQELVMFDGTTGQVKNSGITPTSISQLSTAVGGKLSNKGTAANQIYVTDASYNFVTKSLSTVIGDSSSKYAESAGSATNATNATNASNVVVKTSSSNTSYPLIFGAALGTSAGKATTLYTDTANGVTYNPSTNTINASVFSGSLSGNATSASTADKVANTFDISVAGADRITYNGSANTTLAFAGSGATTVSQSVSGKTLTVTINSTDTDTKVTSAANHYAPLAYDSSKLTLDASSSTAATWGSTDMITGITLKRDEKGHIVDASISSIQMPSNPNTDKSVLTSSTTSKIYLIGKIDASKDITSTARYNANVYVNASNQIVAASGAVASNNTALVTGGTVYTAIEAAKTAATSAATVYWETLS